MSVIKAIEFECMTCGKVQRTEKFKSEERDDGACGDPECCGGAYAWAVVVMTCPVCNKDTEERLDD